MPTADRIADPWGARTPYGPGEDWPVRVDTYLQEGITAEQVDRWVQTASILHSNGDGMDIAVRDERIVGVRGRAGTGSTMAGWARRTCSAGRPTPHRTGWPGR